MEERVCKKCLNKKSIARFSISGYLKNGSPKRRNQCNSCKNIENLRRIKNDPNYVAPTRLSKEERRIRTNQSNKKWRENNAEKWKIINRARSHMRRTLGTINAEQWIAKVCKLGNKCLSCGISGENKKLTIDHKTPVKHGGTNDISNLQPLCLDCNKSKFTKIIDFELINL